MTRLLGGFALMLFLMLGLLVPLISANRDNRSEVAYSAAPHAVVSAIALPGAVDQGDVTIVTIAAIASRESFAVQPSPTTGAPVASANLRSRMRGQGPGNGRASPNDRSTGFLAG